MIIPPNDPSKYPMDKKRRPSADDEPPPSYTDASSIASGSGSTSPTSTPTFKSKPTNFLKLYNQDSSIRGEFVIDPSLRIPTSMCPPPQTGSAEDEDEDEGGRRNLCLASRCSSVRADVWLIGNGGGKERAGVGSEEEGVGGEGRRTTIALRSEHGSVHAQLHTVDDPPRAPFALTARASHGAIRLALPRSFHGILALSTRHGSITVSDALVQNATQLAQVGNTRRYFVGEFAALGEDGWDGDEVECEAPHGSVKVRYVDEGGPGEGKKKGLLSRLFGK